jgi:hypothetical protein
MLLCLVYTCKPDGRLYRVTYTRCRIDTINLLNAELNPICHFASIIRRFNVYGSVHLKYIPIYTQQDATLHNLFISGNCSTCFGWYFHQTSGAHTTVSTASGISHTVTAICRYRGRVGTGLSVLWVAYATHSTLKLGVKRWRTKALEREERKSRPN